MSFEGQSTSTRSLFYRQYTNILEEIAPTVVGTGATLGVCKFWYTMFSIFFHTLLENYKENCQEFFMYPDPFLNFLLWGLLMPTMPWCGGLSPLGIGVPPLSSPIPRLPVDSLPNQIFNTQELALLDNSGCIHSTTLLTEWYHLSVWGAGGVWSSHWERPGKVQCDQRGNSQQCSYPDYQQQDSQLEGWPHFSFGRILLGGACV